MAKKNNKKVSMKNRVKLSINAHAQLEQKYQDKCRYSKNPLGRKYDAAHKRETYHRTCRLWTKNRNDLLSSSDKKYIWKHSQ